MFDESKVVAFLQGLQGACWETYSIRLVLLWLLH